MVKRIDFETLHKAVLALLGNSAFEFKTPFEMYNQDPEKIKDYLLDYLQK